MTISLTEPEQLGLSTERLVRISGWMDSKIYGDILPCTVVLVARHGQPCFVAAAGWREAETKAPAAEDTIFRIYSMTKPVTSVAAMMLYEQGRFQLDDPVARFLPEFADMRVWVSGEGTGMTTRPAEGPITIHQLLTHTSGLTYGFLEETPVDALYRDRKVEFNAKTVATTETLETMTPRLAELPLIADPGTRWNYSNSTDVLGRLVEVVAGQPLDRFFADRIFAPLGMPDTGFRVPADKLDRFAALYGVGETGGYDRLNGIADSHYADDVTLFSGGGGLVSTIGDYFRFTEFLRRKGELDGVRLLGRKTVEFMTSNQLPGDLAAMGQPVFAETTYEGIGFGLGFSVMLDPAKAKIIGSPGEHAWGGAASTAFWIDPVEDMTVVFMTQLLPSSAYPLRRELRVLTYQALVD